MPARCVKPSGRSLEPRSDARPRGMAVPRQQCCGQNSAYRSGCFYSIFVNLTFAAHTAAAVRAGRTSALRELPLSCLEGPALSFCRGSWSFESDAAVVGWQWCDEFSNRFDEVLNLVVMAIEMLFKFGEL